MQCPKIICNNKQEFWRIICDIKNLQNKEKLEGRKRNSEQKIQKKHDNFTRIE